MLCLASGFMLGGFVLCTDDLTIVGLRGGLSFFLFIRVYVLEVIATKYTVRIHMVKQIFRYNFSLLSQPEAHPLNNAEPLLIS